MSQNAIFSVEQQTRFGKPIESLLISVAFATDDSVFIKELEDRFPTATIRPKWGNCSVAMQFPTVENCTKAIREIVEILNKKLSKK